MLLYQPVLEVFSYDAIYMALGFRSFDPFVSSLPPFFNVALYRCNALSRVESGLITSMKFITIPLLVRRHHDTLKKLVSERQVQVELFFLVTFKADNSGSLVLVSRHRARVQNDIIFVGF
jgi:hypothetical protein